MFHVPAHTFSSEYTHGHTRFHRYTQTLPIHRLTHSHTFYTTTYIHTLSYAHTRGPIRCLCTHSSFLPLLFCLHAHTEVQTHRPRSPCFGVTQPPLPGPEQQPSALSGAHTLPSWLGGSQTGRRATTHIWLGPPGTRAGRCPGSPAWGERGALPCPSS